MLQMIDASFREWIIIIVVKINKTNALINEAYNIIHEMHGLNSAGLYVQRGKLCFSRARGLIALAGD